MGVVNRAAGYIPLISVSVVSVSSLGDERNVKSDNVWEEKGEESCSISVK